METENMTIDKINKLKALQFISGRMETADQFQAKYKTMAEACEASGDPIMAKALEGIKMRQSAFIMMNSWGRLHIDFILDQIERGI